MVNLFDCFSSFLRPEQEVGGYKFVNLGFGKKKKSVARIFPFIFIFMKRK